MFDGRWRQRVDRRTGPIGERLRRLGITADVLTAAGLALSVATAFAVGSGHLHLAIVLLALTGFADLLDGPVAKASGTASVRGAFFDSVADRMSDAIVMGGVTWYLAAHHQGGLVLLPLAILGACSLVSYERAKAEALGLSAKGGLMERAERMILLGAGFLASWLLVPVLCVMLTLTLATATGRFLRVWRLAEGPPKELRHAPRRSRAAGARWRPGRVESRWRPWREGAAPGASARRTSGQPIGRWRARRQEALTSRSGRAMRARRGDRLRRSSAEGRGSGLSSSHVSGRRGNAPRGGSQRSDGSRSGGPGPGGPRAGSRITGARGGTPRLAPRRDR